MPSASVSIFEERTSAVGQITYDVRITGPRGEPLAGAELAISLDGSGSLASGFSSKDIKREVDANGVTRVTWYRRSIYDRDVKATMTVTSERTDASIEIITLTPEQASQGSWISWAPRRMFR